MMEFRDKKVMIIGLGRTGVETAPFLTRQGAVVTVSDARPAHDLSQEIEGLAGLPLRYLLGGEDPSWVRGMDYVIPSPGVPINNVLLQEALKHGTAIMSEIELAYRFLRAPLVAVTGTNGKSTTTTLIGEIFKSNGLRVFVGGNLGTPMIGFVRGEWDWGVVEISSFQLEWVQSFRPRIALLLNLSEDHLDRYENFATYCRAKERIFDAQQEDDVAILNHDDPLVWSMREKIRAKVVSFGFSPRPQGVVATAEQIFWRDGSNEETFPLHRVHIQGVHNVENMMAAVAAAKTIGIPRNVIQSVLESFPGLQHRLEFVRERNGVRYYNDSKGTNVGALNKSLASFQGPVILIAGGVDKGGDYGVLENELKEKVRRLVLFGAAKEIMFRALGHLTETTVVDSLQAAVKDAAEHAQPGDVVLLSPACSSFDMFSNYAERGEAFRNLVQAL